MEYFNQINYKPFLVLPHCTVRKLEDKQLANRNNYGMNQIFEDLNLRKYICTSRVVCATEKMIKLSNKLLEQPAAAQCWDRYSQWTTPISVWKEEILCNQDLSEGNYCLEDCHLQPQWHHQEWRCQQHHSGRLWSIQKWNRKQNNVELLMTTSVISED